MLPLAACAPAGAAARTGGGYRSDPFAIVLPIRVSIGFRKLTSFGTPLSPQPATERPLLTISPFLVRNAVETRSLMHDEP
jgi:hypothetical protein